MSGFRKIIPFFCVFSILFSLAPVPASAAGSEWGIYSFWDQAFKDFEQWLGLNPEATPADYDGFGGGARDGGGFMNYWRSDNPTCTSSDAPGGYHYIDPDDRGGGAGVEGGENVYMPRCLYCHELFEISGDSLGEAYQEYLSSLPVSGVSSSGSLIWHTSLSDYHSTQDITSTVFEVTALSRSNNIHYDEGSGTVDSGTGSYFLQDEFTLVITSGGKYSTYFYGLGANYIQVPVDGYYSVLPDSIISSITYRRSDGTSESLSMRASSAGFSRCYRYAGEWIQFERCSSSSVGGHYAYDVVNTIYPYDLLIEPDDQSVVSNSYAINSRPTSVTGDYGIIGDDGQIIKIDTSTIINETNNTYTNPGTGTTSTITDWTYDYSDRSYNVTLESGDTVTVTYGDETILIQEGDTTYNIYYITQGTGGGGEEDPGTDTCQHTYSSSVSREPTCTVPGQTTYTCSLCGHTYTESIPATGHTWTVLQSVTTEYDQEGNLIQQGYTLYQCSICGEQYKDEDGTGPPGSGEDGGGESIWDKLGNLIGSVFDGLLGVVEAVIGKVLDALIALVEMISERLVQVVTLVLSFFDEIPQLFAGFLGFLGALFPFLPEEVMLLLTFGIAVLVFIGIIKALRR